MRRSISSGARLWRRSALTAVFGAGLIVVVVTVVSMARASPRLSGGAGLARPAMGPERDPRATTTTEAARSLPPLLPTAASPLRVLEIGDSLGIDLGDQLRSQLDASATARTVVASLGDSGLSNVSYYDWPAHLGVLLATDHPQVVVVFIGANDDQGLTVDGSAAAPGTPAWVAAYAERVDDVVREATDAGARVVWVGMPPMADPDLNAAMELEDAIYQSQTAPFPGALYVSSTPVLGSPSGGYETSRPGAAGQPVVLRTPDGVHLTPAGAALLAHTVIDAVEKRWDLTLGTPPEPAATAPG